MIPCTTILINDATNPASRSRRRCSYPKFEIPGSRSGVTISASFISVFETSYMTSTVSFLRPVCPLSRFVKAKKVEVPHQSLANRSEGRTSFLGMSQLYNQSRHDTVGAGGQFQGSSEGQAQHTGNAHSTNRQSPTRTGGGSQTTGSGGVRSSSQNRSVGNLQFERQTEYPSGGLRRQHGADSGSNGQYQRIHGPTFDRLQHNGIVSCL